MACYFGPCVGLNCCYFAVLNNQAVPVNFGFTKISGPLILIILGSAIIGALVGLLTSTTTIWNQRKELKAVQKSWIFIKMIWIN